MEQVGHKVDLDIIWKDNWNKSNWEMAIGEFSGKPFDVSLDKCNKDKCKLFRCMKDILDLRITKIIEHCNKKINQEIYEIIKTMKVLGVHSYGKNSCFIFYYNLKLFFKKKYFFFF